MPKLMCKKIVARFAVFLILSQPFIGSLTAFASTSGRNEQAEVTDTVKEEIQEEQENVTENKETDSSSADPKLEVPKEAPINDNARAKASPNVFDGTQLETLTIDQDGKIYYKGEVLYVGANEEKIPANLNQLMKKGIPQKLTLKSGKALVGIQYNGQVSYGGTTVGAFSVNGKTAFCMQHPKPTPATGTQGELSPYTNVNIQRIMYYGWDGPENIFGTDRERGIVVTSLVLSKYYNGDVSGTSIPGWTELDNLAQNGSIRSHKIQINQLNSLVNLEVDLINGKQISKTGVLNADVANTIRPSNIPSGITFVNETTGEKVTNGIPTIKGGDKFHLEADVKTTYKYNSGVQNGVIKSFQPLVVRPTDSGLQDIGTWQWYDDPSQVVSFKADFFAREGWLNLIKKGNDTTQNLAGADYQILQNNVVLQTVTTATDGTIKTKGLLPGTYQVKEIKAPKGYTIDRTVKTVTVSPNETTTVTFTNTAVLGQFVLFKADAQTGTIAQGDASLAGAEFDIKTMAGSVVDHVVIAPDGSEFKATSKKLPLGKYLRVETKAPPGYVVDPTPVEMELKYETQDIPLVTTTETVKNQVILGKVAIQKYYELIIGGGDLSPEAGAEFSFTLKSSGVEYDRKETNEKGYLETVRLPFGTYNVHQTKSLPGLLKVDDFEVEVTEDGATYFYALLNNHFVSPMKLIKADEDTGKNVLVPGTVFKIKSVETGEWLSQTTHNITEFETNEQGEVLLFDKVKHGDYLLYEIEAPDGYVKNPEPLPFSVTEENQEAGLINVTFKNKAQVGKVTLTKTGEAMTDAGKVETDYGTQYTPIFTQKPLEGAEFNFNAAEDIYTKDGTLRYAKGETVDTGVSNEIGEIVTTPETNPFYPGHYEAVEIAAPVGFVVDETPIPFEVEYEGQDVEISSTTVQAKNVLQELLIKIYKTEGAVIEWENGQPVIEQTPSDGKVFGVFARDGFDFNEHEVIPSGGLMALATTKDGVAEVQAKFPEGKFFVREVDAGTDHLLDEKEYDFTFKAQDNAPVYEIGIWKDSVAYGNENHLKLTRNSIENELAVQEIELVKVDLETTLGSETPLANVPFNLVEMKDGKERVIGEYKTNADGKINVTVPVGTYKFVEIEPLENYLPSDQDYPFEVIVEHNGDKILLKAINQLKAPTLGTKATGINGEKHFDSTIENTVVDDLNFYIPLLNQEMTIVTELKEASTGKVVQSQEEKKTFTEANGTHRITMVIPANTLDPGKDYVFAEYVYRDSEKTILYVDHDDLGDKGQTIHMRPLIRFFPQTGEERLVYATTLGLTCLLFYVSLRHREQIQFHFRRWKRQLKK